MKILQTLITLVILTIALELNAQATINPDIQKRLDAFIELTNQKKYSEAFDLMYPKLFDHVSKQELIDMMAAMDSGLSLRVANPQITKFSSPFQDGSETFVRLDYVADMTVDVIDGGMFDSPKATTAILQQFEATYGEPSVEWNDAEKKYTIKADKAMMAIKGSEGDWYLLEINTDQMDLMKSLFSEPVVNTLVKVQ